MKILTMADSTHTISGFGTVMRNLNIYLSKVGHDVAHIGWQHFGQETVGSFHDEVYDYTELPNLGGHKFGRDALKFWLGKYRPDLLLVLSDFWMISYIYKTEITTPFCMYYPIDGYPITNQIKEMLKRVDYRVCMSEYGTNLVKEEGIDTHHIPHGVKTDIFKPKGESEINAMKSKLGIPLNNTVIGRVDRNQTRKKIPRTIKSFKLLHDQYPNTSLLLWMDKRDKEGYDLPFVIDRFDLKEGRDVFFPAPDQMATFMYGVPEDELATVMNCMDIHSGLTGGEGFGCSLAETLSCGAVNVATNYTSPAEIFQFGTDEQCGLPVKVEMFECGTAGVDRAYADVEHAYEQMKWLIENPDERKVMSERGVRRVREHYDYDIIVKQFDEYLRSLDLVSPRRLDDYF